jgi:hypothetical protein
MQWIKNLGCGVEGAKPPNLAGCSILCVSNKGWRTGHDRYTRACFNDRGQFFFDHWGDVYGWEWSEVTHYAIISPPEDT